MTDPSPLRQALERLSAKWRERSRLRYEANKTLHHLTALHEHGSALSEAACADELDAVLAGERREQTLVDGHRHNCPAIQAWDIEGACKCDRGRDEAVPLVAERRSQEEPTLTWRYVGEELAVFWVNPWSSREEKIATFWWPTHPMEDTERAEAMFEQFADRLVGKSAASRPAAPTPSNPGKASCSHSNAGRLVLGATEFCEACGKYRYIDDRCEVKHHLAGRCRLPSSHTGTHIGEINVGTSDAPQLCRYQWPNPPQSEHE